MIIEIFSKVKDPRELGKVKHELEDVLRMALIIKMERERTEKGIRSSETIYYQSSQEKDEASYYAQKIRNYWGIENKLHWHLDVTFKEDVCRVRAKNGAVNFSAMRKYALEMLKKQDDKLSLKRRRKKCGRNIDYLLKVFKES